MGWVVFNTTQCSICGGKINPRTAFTKAIPKNLRNASNIPYLIINWHKDPHIGTHKDQTPVLFCSQDCSTRLKDEISVENLINI